MPRSTFGLIAILPLLIGCSSDNPYDFAPVSGTVIINGEPAENIIVFTEPDSEVGENATSAPGSAAITDASGRFILKKAVGTPVAGAYIGTHRVMLSGAERVADSQKAYRTPEELRQISRFTLTQEQKDAGTIEVPPGGLDDVEFVIDGAEPFDPASVVILNDDQ